MPKQQIITAVIGPEPMREGEYPTVYLVGMSHGSLGTPNVDRIAYREDNFGDHGIGWFDVYADGQRVASVTARHVAEVRYAPGDDPQSLTG